MFAMMTAAVLGQQGAGGGGGVASVAFVGVLGDDANASEYTFTAADIGAADADRTVVLGIGSRRGSVGLAISSVTVGGAAATELIQVTNTSSNSVLSALYAINVASGTTADIVVTFDVVALRCGVAVWRTTGTGTTPLDTDSSMAADGAGSLSVSNDGAVIGLASTGAANTDFTWTGITENFEANVGGENSAFSGASAEFASSATEAVTATALVSTAPAAVYASW